MITASEALAFVLSPVLHELGHFLTAELQGLRAKRVTICWRGLGVWRAPGTPRQNLVVAAAGPAITLYWAWALLPYMPWVAWANVALAIFNLWPTWRSSDGAKMLHALKQLKMY